MVKMAPRYFANYDLIKIKILTSTKETFGKPGKSTKKAKHVADGFRVVFLPCSLTKNKKIITKQLLILLVLISAVFS